MLTTIHSVHTLYNKFTFIKQSSNKNVHLKYILDSELQMCACCVVLPDCAFSRHYYRFIKESGCNLATF